jgi:PAS domain S-box-containing protein
MEPNTALCLAALGSSLLCSAAWRDGRIRSTALELGRLCSAVFAIVIAGLSIDPAAIDTPLSVIFLALAYCLRNPGGKRRLPSRMIGNAILFLSAAVLLSYIYDVHPGRGLGSGASNFFTVACLFFLSAGLLLLDPERGLMGILRSQGAGGKVARRLVPAAVVVPVLIAGLKLLGDRMGLYEPSFGVIIVAVTYMILLSALTGWIVQSLERSDCEREAAEEAAQTKGELLNLTGEMAKVGGWEFDAATGEGTWTDEVARIHGLDPSIATSRSFGIGFYEGESRSRIEDAISAAIAEERPYDLELDLRAADGVLKRVHTIGLPIVAEGRVVSLRGIFQDVSEMRRAQEELRQSEERFSKAFAASPMGQSISSLAEGRLIAVNEAYCKIIGYSRDELVGSSSLELGLFVDPTNRADFVSTLMRGRSVRDIQIDVRTKSGKLKTVILSMTPISLGGEKQLIASVVDITSRLRAEKALRESERRFRLLVESSPLPIGFTSPDGRVLFVNHRFTEVFGYSQDDLPTLDAWYVAAYPRAEYRSWVRESWETLLATGAALSHRSLEFEVTCKDGSIRVVELSGAVLEGGVFSIFNDVTDRSKAEAEIHKLNAELEERVRRRTSQLEEANAELEAFSYSVSHDLRSPLRGIDGWSAALEEDYGSSLDQTASGYLHRVRGEAQRMGTLIDSLLQLARVGRAEMTREDLDLSELAGATTARLAEANPGRTFEFSIQSGLQAKGDRRLIEIALGNLLDNACKYTSKRDVARIEFGRSPDSSFFVRDNGAGFDMAYASKLFAPFQRMHKTSEFPGTGIGLATVQRIVAKHGGKIWADAAPGVGAVFYFTLEDAS